MRPHHAVPTSAAHLNSPQGQRQVRGPPPNMPSTHAGMRPTYGPPPPLRTALQASHSLSGTSERTTPGAGPPEHHGTPYAGGPPPARHASPHLNPYR